MTDGGQAESPGAPAGVLIADDYPPNRTALRALLGPVAAITDVDSGERALQEITRRDYAVVVLDIHMPGIGGVEVARRIRAGSHNAQVPIIFLTAMESDAAQVLEGYAAGAVDYLRLPFEPLILRSKVAVFVELHQRREQAKREAAERARLEAERAAARERAEAATREAEHQRADQLKDEFLATLAHELRTPLTSLVVAADCLERVPVPDATVTQLHGLIRGQLTHLCRLVEDLLEISRFTQGKIALRPATIDLRDVVRQAIELSRAAIDAQGIDLDVGLPAQPVSTFADPVRLAQVASNLINNAAKFSYWGGRVAVSLERVEHQALIKVRDWGRGIPPPDLGRIFEPFVQSEVGDTWRGGLGIGLALVRKLVELHEGSVWANSEGRGRGAEFVVALPLSEASAHAGRGDNPHPDHLPVHERGSEGEPARVLVVDDNAEVRRALQLFLQLAGHSVTTVDSGRAALDEIARTDPDVVLLDIDMPDLDGYAVARMVRASRADWRPRLVAMTGKVEPGERARALRTGFDAHVPKPVDGRTLIRIVAER